MILMLVVVYLLVAIVAAILLGKDAHNDGSATLAIIGAAFWPLTIVVLAASNIAHSAQIDQVHR